MEIRLHIHAASKTPLVLTNSTRHMHTTRIFFERALTLRTHIRFATDCVTEQILLESRVICVLASNSLMPESLALFTNIACTLLTFSLACSHLEVRQVEQFIAVRFWTVKESPLRLNNFSVNNMCLVKFDDWQLEQGMYFCF